MLPSRFEAALFDVDGTLVNSLPMIVAGLGDSFEKFTGHRPPDAEIRAMVGTPLSVQMNLFGMDQLSSSTVEERIAATIEHYQHHRCLASLFAPAVDAMRLLQEHGVPVALVTSRNRQESDWLLEEFPIFERADTLVCASDVSQPKPAPDCAFLAAQRLSALPSNCVFLGDSIHDMHCAKAAGMATVAVSYGAASQEELSETRPDHHCATPEELLDWVRSTLEQQQWQARFSKPTPTPIPSQAAISP